MNSYHLLKKLIQLEPLTNNRPKPLRSASPTILVAPGRRVIRIVPLGASSCRGRSGRIACTDLLDLSRGAVCAGGSLGREFERRFEAYKSQVVKPFFRDHFARIDRQIVLVDALGAIHSGPRAVEDMRRSMTNILTSFRPGRTSWLGSLLGTRRVERILFAATKADYLHHTQHLRLTAIMAAMMREAKDRADFAGETPLPCRLPPSAPPSRKRFATMAALDAVRATS